MVIDAFNSLPAWVIAKYSYFKNKIDCFFKDGWFI